MILREELLAKHKPFKARPELLRFGQIPAPMSGTAPRVVLGEEWWNETRQAAYASTGYRCAACGVSKYDAKEHHWLEGHEVYDVNYRKGRMVYIECVPMCHYCHAFIHDGRLLALLEAEQITKQKFNAVLRHGRAVLRKAGMKRVLPKLVLDGVAEWEDWRLVVNGVEYPPIIKSVEEWRRKFGRKGVDE